MLSRQDTLDPLAIAMATVVAPTLFPSKIEFDEGDDSLQPVKSHEAVEL